MKFKIIGVIFLKTLTYLKNLSRVPVVTSLAALSVSQLTEKPTGHATSSYVSQICKHMSQPLGLYPNLKLRKCQYPRLPAKVCFLALQKRGKFG